VHHRSFAPTAMQEKFKRENVRIRRPGTGYTPDGRASIIAVRLGWDGDCGSRDKPAVGHDDGQARGSAASYKSKAKRLQSDVGRNKTRDAVARVALISFGCASATATA
jgi:hypothetical protein